MTKRQTFVAEITLSVDAFGTQQTFYFATEGFTTKPTDTPANTFVAGYISDPGSFRAELFSGARMTGPVRPSFGQIALSNHAGVLDGWLDYGTGGRVVVRVGEVGAAYPAAFSTVLIAYSYSLIVDFKEVRVVLRDRLFLLDKPIVTDVFLGTGNLEGTGTATRKKQLVLGQPGFIPPILIDRARQIYFVQANAADERAFRGTFPPLYLPFEGGGGLNFEGYYTTEERLLNAAAPSAGAFKIYGPGVDGVTPQTTESTGPIYIRLGSPPEYDVRFKAAGYVKDTPAQWARPWTFVSLCARAGVSVTLAPGSYEKSAGNQLIDADQTYLESMADSCTATFSAFGFDSLDRFVTVDLQDPSEGVDAPVFEFNQNNAKDFRRQPVPGQEQPVWQVNINSGRTWTSSTRTSLTPEGRDIFTRSPWQTTFVGTSDSVRLANPGAESALVDVQGNDFPHESSRRQFVRRYIELFGARRDLLSVTALAITPEILAIALHDKVTVKMPRLGCGAGRAFRVVTTELNLKARTATFGLWGGAIGPSDAMLGGGNTSPGGGTGNTTPPSGAGTLTDWYQIAYGRVIGGGGGGQATLTDFAQIAYGRLVTGDPYFSNVVLLLHGDGANGTTSFVDHSSVPKTISAFGSAQHATAQKRFGAASIYLNGAGNYLSATHADLVLGGDYCIEAWVYMQSYASAGSNRMVVSNFISNGISRTNLYITHDGYLVLLEQYDSGNNPISAVSATGGFPLNTWIHVAGSKQGTTLRVFVDGVLRGSATSPVRVFGSSIRIGRHDSGASEFPWHGYIDEVRVTKGVPRYTASFTPPTTAFPNS